jgi:predicted glutamine amidotransferase
LHSELGAEATNGDGFCVGWYDYQPTPGVFRSIEPAWNDANLRELAAHIKSGLFLEHIRAAIGSAVQQTSCHPFRHGRWLFMHNGFLAELATVKRDVVLAVDESLYPEIKRQAETELLFYLALTFGLEDDPIGAVTRAIGLVEQVGHRRGVKYPFQGTVATTDGERIWAFRYSSEGKSRSLFFTGRVPTLRHLSPEREILQEVSDDARLIRVRADGRSTWRLERGAGIVLRSCGPRRRSTTYLQGQASHEGRRGQRLSAPLRRTFGQRSTIRSRPC